jgi:ankyrin repeat protein
LKLAIQALKDPSELTELKFGATQLSRSDRDGIASPQNLLSRAAWSGVIDKVQALIDCLTPIGVGIGGMFTTSDTPLMMAARSGYDDILRLLLERGASFSVKVDECLGSPYYNYVPSELLYLMFESMHDRSISEGHMRCATLAMRSWRHEKGFESIQRDPRLQKIARTYTSTGDFIIIQLLKAYGVDGSNPQPYEMGFSMHGSSDIDSSWLDNIWLV